MKLEDNKESDKNRRKRNNAKDKRFYSSLDMAIIKRDSSFKEAQIKRSVIPNYPNNGIAHCGCGAVGCFIHYGTNNEGAHANAPVNMLTSDKDK